MVQTLGPNLIGLAILGEAALGLFRAVGQLTNALNLPINALQQILPGTATKLYRMSGDGEMLRYLRATAAWVSLYFCVAGIAVYLAAPFLAGLLFDAEPAGFGVFILLFIAANLFISLRVVLANAFVSRGTPQPMVVIHAVSALVAVIVAGFAAVFGVVMLPVSVAVSTLTGLTLCFWFVRRTPRHG